MTICLYSESSVSSSPKNKSQSKSFCLQGDPPDLRFLHHNNQQQNVTLLVNHKLETRSVELHE